MRTTLLVGVAALLLVGVQARNRLLCPFPTTPDTEQVSDTFLRKDQYHFNSSSLYPFFFLFFFLSPFF